jgi:Preprotein translocase subunit SecD
VNAEGDLPAKAVADVFPAYDDDGGCCSSSRRRGSAMGTRRRHLFILLFVVGLVVVSGLVIAAKETKLGLDLQGGLEVVLKAQPPPGHKLTPPTSTARSRSCGTASTSSACRRRRSGSREPTRS